jgi:hypothetical protein
MLIEWVGIKVEERIPDDLLWALYNSGLVWSGKRMTEEPDDVDLEEFKKHADGKRPLSSDQKLRIRQFIEQYEGDEPVHGLNSLVSDVSYEEPESDLESFGDKNELSHIVDEYFDANIVHNQRETYRTDPSREQPSGANEGITQEQRHAAQSVLDDFGVDSDLDYPDDVIASIPGWTKAFYTLENIGKTRSSIIYKFTDSGKWNGPPAIESSWRVFELRVSSTSADFEIEFDISTDSEKVGPEAIVYVIVSNGEITHFELHPDFQESSTRATIVEGEDGKSVHEEPYSHFRDYAYNRIEHTFASVPYSYRARRSATTNS